MNHTPGPWIACEQKDKYGASLGWIIEFNGGRIGWSSFADTASNKAETPPYRISGANAALIAAAPDLLAALIDCANRLESCALAGGSDKTSVAALMSNFRPIIAKAQP